MLECRRQELMYYRSVAAGPDGDEGDWPELPQLPILPVQEEPARDEVAAERDDAEVDDVAALLTKLSVDEAQPEHSHTPTKQVQLGAAKQMPEALAPREEAGTTVAELRKELRRRGLRATGRKQDLIDRLAAALEQEADDEKENAMQNPIQDHGQTGSTSVGKNAQPATLVGLDGTVVVVHDGCTVILGTRRGAGRFEVRGSGVEATHCSVEFAYGKLVLKDLS